MLVRLKWRLSVLVIKLWWMISTCTTITFAFSKWRLTVVLNVHYGLAIGIQQILFFSPMYNTVYFSLGPSKPWRSPTQTTKTKGLATIPLNGVHCKGINLLKKAFKTLPYQSNWHEIQVHITTGNNYEFALYIGIQRSHRCGKVCCCWPIRTVDSIR